jgi:hypothetical protein
VGHVRNRVESVEDEDVHEVVLHPHPLKGLGVVEEGAGGAQVGDGQGASVVNAASTLPSARGGSGRSRTLKPSGCSGSMCLRAVRPSLLVAAMAT